jgi:uncharacterized protein
MVVTIEEIKESGLQLDEPVSLELVKEALGQEGRDTGFRAEGASRLKATLHRVSDGVLLEAAFEAQVQAPCKRCLADVQVKVPVDFTLNLVPSRADAKDALEEGMEDDGKAPRAGSFDLDAADQEPFDGRKINLDPILREQLLLALPMYVVCRDDCQGLCTVCGQNLNEKACGCDRTVVDPRLLPLKNIKLN